MVGRTLKEQREALGISLEEASSGTRIQLLFLQSLEEEIYDCFPDPQYLTGFLRRYALYLGLDADALVGEFQASLTRPRIVEVGPLRKEPISTWKKGRFRPRWPLIAIGLPLLLLPFLYVVFHRAPEEGTSPSSSRLLQDVGVPLPKDRAPSASSESGKASPGPLKGPGHTLSLFAREKSWVLIQADEEVPRDMLLLEGQTLSLSARNHFLITLGNAGGVELVLDGKKLSPLGSSGQVIRDLVLPTR